MSFLRLSVFLLVLANLVLFAWNQGAFGSRDEGREPQRLAAQKSPEKLRILKAGEEEPAPAGEQPPASEPQPQSQPQSQPEASADCRVLSGFKLADAKQWITDVQAKQAGFKFNVAAAPQTSYDVAIIGLAGSVGVASKQKELNALGIRAPLRTVADGGNRYALVFATLATEPEAQSYLKNLNGQGVKTARVIARTAPEDAALVQVRGSAPALATLLAGRKDIRIEECRTH